MGTGTAGCSRTHGQPALRDCHPPELGIERLARAALQARSWLALLRTATCEHEAATSRPPGTCTQLCSAGSTAPASSSSAGCSTSRRSPAGTGAGATLHTRHGHEDAGRAAPRERALPPPPAVPARICPATTGRVPAATWRPPAPVAQGRVAACGTGQARFRSPPRASPAGPQTPPAPAGPLPGTLLAAASSPSIVIYRRAAQLPGRRLQANQDTLPEIKPHLHPELSSTIYSLSRTCPKHKQKAAQKEKLTQQTFYPTKPCFSIQTLFVPDLRNRTTMLWKRDYECISKDVGGSTCQKF